MSNRLENNQTIMADQIVDGLCENEKEKINNKWNESRIDKIKPDSSKHQILGR